MTKDPKEYAAFEVLLKVHFAQLSTVTQEFTRRLWGRERDEFMTLMLETAWNERRAFNPRQQSLIAWWADCCTKVALSRPEWICWYITGPKMIKGEHLRSA